MVNNTEVKKTKGKDRIAFCRGYCYGCNKRYLYKSRHNYWDSSYHASYSPGEYRTFVCPLGAR